MGSKIIESSGDIFKDLGFSAEQSEKMNIKSHLMAEIETFIKTEKLTQEQASKIMGVSRPRISDVTRGRIDKFTIDALVDMLTKAGHHVQVLVEKAA
ncbi:MAG: helix-turn-helix domain-containing protein [Proteobacteria bacterium]|nr:helix-turn-helix domain-containing protein [Pseudomonadota bacterium]